MNDNFNELESQTNDYNIINRTFFDKYKCIKKLGEGSFGMLYKAEYNHQYFALKFEDRIKGSNLLESESTIMNYLKGPNIPYLKSFGYSGDYNILVMQLLGKSLENIFKENKNFSIKTICQLACQMIDSLEYIHNRHIIHRDIKPGNFLMGLDDLSQFLFLVDFGLAKKFRSSKTLIQYPMTNKKKLTGTARYASRNALEGLEQSRRDDLESVGYVLIYLLKGSLPWQGLQAKNKEERYRKIFEKKKEVSSRELCYGYPEEIREFIDYTKGLQYTEDPDYEMCRKYFLMILYRDKLKFDYIYDWTTEEELKMRKENTLKTNVDSHLYYNKSIRLKYQKIKSSYKEDKKEYNEKTVKEVIYKTKKPENVNNNNNDNNNNQEITPTLEKKKTDKVDSKCCCQIF